MNTEDQNIQDGGKKSNSPIGDFLKKVQEGARGMTAGKPPRDEKTDPPLSEAAAGAPPEATAEQGQHQPTHDNDEPLLIDAQAEVPEPKSKAKPGLSRKHGLILVGVLVVVGVIYKPTPKSPPESEPAVESPAPAQPEMGLAIPSSEDPSTPAGEEGSRLGNGGANINPIGATMEELDLVGPLNVPKEDKSQLPSPPAEESPFGFPGQPTSESPAGSPGVPPTPQWSSAGSPFGELSGVPAGANTDQPGAAGSPLLSAPPEAQLGQAGGNVVAGKDDTILAGEAKKNPDSEQQPNLQADTAVEMSELKAKLALQDQKILDLQKALDAKGKAPGQQPKAASHSTSSAAKPRSYAATQAKPKVGPRPKICVKAVAPPARNCSTCVAHAFVVDTNREDTMVGQGDYIAGFRVAITGDRIDLQNSAGEVVHKFWSQPNGCPSI
ncbi:hypothetical protein ACWAUP_000275 [Pseudomonas aeruginosa]